MSNDGIGYERLNRRRNWITDYGARPESGFDNSEPIRKAIRAAMSPGGSGVVDIPELRGSGNDGAVFEIHQNNVLHPQAAGASAGWGLTFRGENRNRTWLKLVRSPGQKKWLYDAQDGEAVSSSGLPGYNRGPMVLDLGLMTDMPDPLVGRSYNPDHAADVNGFRWWAGPSPASPAGHDKQQYFERVRIAGFGTPIEWAGSQNADFGEFHYVNFQNNGPLICHNLNALIVLFLHCNCWYPQDFFRVKSTTQHATQSPNGGGGDFVFDVCDFIHEGYDGEDLDVPCYTQNFVDGVTHGADWIRYTTYRNCRWELRSRNSRLLSDRGNVVALPSRETAYEYCTLSVQHGTDLLDVREYVQLSTNKVVSFRNCSMPRQFGVGFYDVSDNTVPSRQNQPTVLLDDCKLFPDMVDDLKNRIIIDTDTNPGGHGRLVSRRGVSISPSREGNAAVRRTSYSFDYSKAGKAAGAGEPCGTPYTVYLKASSGAWPSLPSDVPTSERTIYLPPGTTITAAWGRKPASGVAGTLVQYHLGKDDKSYPFASSAPGRADSEHRFYADRTTHPGIFPYVVGEDGETFRAWMTAPPGGTAYSTNFGELALECQ